jgi:sugar lactone lactonase YvrE
MQFDLVLGQARDVLGEGPHYDHEWGHLLWVDIVDGEGWQLDIRSGDLRCWRFGKPVSAFVPRQGGGYLAALRNELVLIDPVSETQRRWSAPEADIDANRSNEARVDPGGQFWLGTMQDNIGPNGEDLPIAVSTGALYRIATDGSYTKLASGIGCSNTLCWDVVRGRLYYGDSVSGTITAYEWDAAGGNIVNPRIFAGPNEHGVPDGSALDAEGYLWNCRWGGSCIIRYDPNGGIDRIIPVPVTQPTSCVFGGEDLRTLYVTSAYAGLSAEQRERNSLEGALLSTIGDGPGQPCTRLAV